ncbi:MAG TPA: tRNA guanosine(34) transglycosylase Tgt [Alphaproteobacteria bacterium]|nr:tRNA guanosine(34) transglycosylase Tgt [Rhodospirillaceae bacterium]HRJ12133.1 tRNA guanosine(34) transglycosylase Tgt [Alphaproteobacteria bacterium]
MKKFAFDILHQDKNTRARIGRLTTPHGSIETPNFIFCATKAAMKACGPHDLCALGVDIILSNTYHLLIQPGSELVQKMGGLHDFMQWQGPMLTDSGGYQIFAMGHGSISAEIKRKSISGRRKTLSKITEDGALFQSYTDGKEIFLTPESSIQIQRELGADLIVMLDECTPFHVDKEYTARSMRMTHRWGDRCLAEFNRSDDGRQQLYGIVQGGVYPDLRREAAEYTASRPFFGTAVGGCLGDTKNAIIEIANYAMPYVAPDRPTHLLGIGGIEEIIRGVMLGIDTFDCVSPTRMARHGWALAPFEPAGRINIRNAQHREDHNPLDTTLNNPASSQFSRAYLHHLFRAGEMLGMQLLTQHNIAVMVRLMAEVRAAIRAGDMAGLAARYGVKL